MIASYLTLLSLLYLYVCRDSILAYMFTKPRLTRWIYRIILIQYITNITKAKETYIYDSSSLVRYVVKKATLREYLRTAWDGYNQPENDSKYRNLQIWYRLCFLYSRSGWSASTPIIQYLLTKHKISVLLNYEEF